jgi:DNA modification methylase
VVTSPPYWGLRSYEGVEATLWPDGWRGVLGMEPTPELYIEHLMACFRECRRVLRPDGTLWINIGDCHATTACGHFTGGSKLLSGRDLSGHESSGNVDKTGVGVRAKSLIGIPQRLFLALQADGWVIHNDAIWNKAESFNDERTGSCMVESVRGRMTHGYEHILFCTPEGDQSGYDWFEARERGQVWKGAAGSFRRASREGAVPGQEHKQHREDRSDGYATQGYRNWRDVWTLKRSPSVEYCRACDAVYRSRDYCKLPEMPPPPGQKHGPKICNCGRHDAWLAHYATFPVDLPYRCIQAGTMPYVCGYPPSPEASEGQQCGRPWKRMISKRGMQIERSARRERMGEQGRTQPSGTMKQPAHYQQVGWRSTCGHPCCNPARAVVLDPFAGTGTTLIAARMLGRDSIGIESSPAYVAMMKRRLREDVGFERPEPIRRHGRKQVTMFTAESAEKGVDDGDA